MKKTIRVCIDKHLKLYLEASDLEWVDCPLKATDFSKTGPIIEGHWIQHFAKRDIAVEFKTLKVKVE